VLHAYYIPWAWKLAILASVYILKVLLSPFRRVEVLSAFQLARPALVARAWPQEVYEME
jgi:predicted lysophospholipase L1 biosynthesis ABC-type transport system permease subunit